MNPGNFKLRTNRAGSTVFVAPELVPGTLRRGFEVGEMVRDAFARALYMMFLIAEVHPFTDGNGRVARIMMNAELATAGEARIVIPTVYRSNYISALKGATHNGHFQGLYRMLAFAQRWTARVDFTDRTIAEEDLRRTNALRDPAEAEAAGVRLQLP
jgi:fido (protein-threonine AMPylation protein)